MIEIIRKSIFVKIAASIVSLIIISSGIPTFISYVNTKNAIFNATIKETEQIATLTSTNLETWIDDIKTDMANLSKRTVFRTALRGGVIGEVGRKSARKRFKKFIKGYDFCLSASLSDLSGVIIASSKKKQIGKSISDQDFFNSVIKGEPVKLPARFNKKAETVSFIVPIPLMHAEKIVGIIFTEIDLAYFSSRFIEKLKIGKSGFLFLIDEQGKYLSHPDVQFIKEKNIMEESWGSLVFSQKKGVFNYEVDDKQKTIYFLTIEDLGWRIAISIDYSDLMAASNQTTIINIVITIVLTLGAIAVIFYISNKISSPIKQATSVTGQIQNGEFSSRVKLEGRIDEVGILCKSLDILAGDLQNTVADINQVMEHVARGDLSFKISSDLKGDLSILKNNVNQSIEMLGRAMFQVINNGERVNTTVNELADSSQNLARGSSKQTSSLASIIDHMKDVGTKAKTNKDMSLSAQSLTNQTLNEIKTGNTQMQEMLESMGRINATSSEVSKVIKIIDEIAFQTNLLALNAAVEAARAGKFGKGFSVVAEEVRNLASRSTKAAKNTSELIEKSIKEIEKGVVTADHTAEILENTKQNVNSIKDLIREISNASADQENSIDQISGNLDEVNVVVNQNSTISEQIAESIEDMTHQSNQLQDLLATFVIK